ncbi:hypothetical protein [Gimesia aquarii]|uniref:Uncharacterized protein n=1 Tax=Gimesia aquarii TaxID=2527964 RepID=A0A517VS79_9PLAN|nr:hypothetical protein [Gimesia aquarii]QDT95872.1 hypothetical protein V144x_13200 [Gimesia aquarii]
MNQDQNDENAVQTNSGSPHKRNPLERILVWGGITVLIVIVAIEYRAKQNYDASVSALQEVANGIRDVSIDEARQLMIGFSQKEGPRPNDQGLNTYHYQWFSLFKGGTYQLTLIENGDQTLNSFDGPAFAEDPDILAAKIKEANTDIGESNPPLIGNALPQDSPVENGTKEDVSEKQETPQKKKSNENDFLN